MIKLPSLKNIPSFLSEEVVVVFFFFSVLFLLILAIHLPTSIYSSRASPCMDAFSWSQRILPPPHAKQAGPMEAELLGGESLYLSPTPAPAPQPPPETRKTTRPPARDKSLRCPRCNSTNTKFCYYNNYSMTQPRYFCKTCRRYWTEGGSLRNIPVGGGSRKNNKRSSLSSSSSTSAPNPPPVPPPIPNFHPLQQQQQLHIPSADHHHHPRRPELPGAGEFSAVDLLMGHDGFVNGGAYSSGFGINQDLPAAAPVIAGGEKFDVLDHHHHQQQNVVGFGREGGEDRHLPPAASGFWGWTPTMMGGAGGNGGSSW